MPDAFIYDHVRTPRGRGKVDGALHEVTALNLASQALGDLQQATMWFLQHALGNPDNAGAGATDYMHLFGLVALGYMWCLIAEAAKAKTGAGDDGATDRMAQRLATGRFFMERMLPATATHLARIKAGAASTMALPAEAF